VLGLDPGSRAVGWGLIEVNAGRVRALGFGCRRPPPKLGRPAALAAIAAKLEEVLAEHPPDVVAVETPFAARFPRAGLALAEARGALLAVLGRWGGRIVELEPAHVKAVVVGSGRAEKQQVAYVVRLELGLEALPPGDAADALAIAMCAARALTLESARC
jgi:crossover junction endodeoxyribonuclease RuvC